MTFKVACEVDFTVFRRCFIATISIALSDSDSEPLSNALGGRLAISGLLPCHHELMPNSLKGVSQDTKYETTFLFSRIGGARVDKPEERDGIGRLMLQTERQRKRFTPPFRTAAAYQRRYVAGFFGHLVNESQCVYSIISAFQQNTKRLFNKACSRRLGQEIDRNMPYGGKPRSRRGQGHAEFGNDVKQVCY